MRLKSRTQINKFARKNNKRMRFSNRMQFFTFLLFKKVTLKPQIIFIARYFVKKKTIFTYVFSDHFERYKIEIACVQKFNVANP